MKYIGTVLQDSLLSDAVLNFVDVKKHDGVITFEVGDDMVLAVAEELSRTLKPGATHASIVHEFDKVVIFPNKIFRFTPKETEKRQKAVEYAKSLGMTDGHIDF